jgi:predicted DNA-binding antitoxin AbrB/MazE fold protein
MGQHIDAIFVNGVFRPEQPVNMADGERVSLTVDAKSSATDDLSDVLDLLDTEFMESCRQRSGKAPSLEAVRQKLAAYPGSLADLICEERNER